MHEGVDPNAANPRHGADPSVHSYDQTHNSRHDNGELGMRQFVLVFSFSLFTAIAVTGAHAQNYFDTGKLNIDKKQYLEDFEKASTGISLQQAGLLPKHRYCVRCTSGEHLNCDVPVGGEAGRAMCGSYGMAKCKSSGGQVDYNGCP